MPTGASDPFGFGGEAGPVGAVVGAAELVLGGGDDLPLALSPQPKIELVGLDPSGRNGKGITADGAPVGVVQAPPTPFPGVRVVRIEPLEQAFLIGLVAGGDKQFAGGPGQFIIVHEFVAVMSDSLVGARLAIFSDRLFEEVPAFLRLC